MARDSPPAPQAGLPPASPPGTGRRRRSSGGGGAAAPLLMPATARSTAAPPADPDPAGPAFVSKWVSLSAGLIVSLCSGLTYLFSLYAPSLRAEFGWDQTQVSAASARRESARRNLSPPFLPSSQPRHSHPLSLSPPFHHVHPS